MKIGVVTTSYPRFAGDHAGNFVAAQVSALRELGHAVEVIGAHTLGAHAGSLFEGGGAPDALERGGLRIHLDAARFSLAQTRAVAARIAQWDLVIAHWLAPSGIAALGALVSLSARALLRGRRGPRLVVIAHGGDLHTLRRLRLLAPSLYALRAANARIVFVSRELAELARAAAPPLAHWLDAASIVQPMGIDVARFAALRDARDSDEAREPRIVVIARLVPVKGVDVAITAHAQLRTHATLVIAGDGPERATLERLASGARVELVGRVDADTRDRLLQEASCVVIPSRVLPGGRSEGTPMIALEALAAGVPVIASDVGGLRELPGITRVPADDAPALAQAIDGVLARASHGERMPSADLAAFDHRQIAARILTHTGAAAVVPGTSITANCAPGDSIGRGSA